VSDARIRPYALGRGEGNAATAFGPTWIIKAGEIGRGRRLAFVEYTTAAGEEPGEHTHPTEDEIFYIVHGAVTFRCDGETYDLEDGGFVFLPRGLPHSYAIRNEGEARLIVITSPADEAAEGGWGGLIGDLESGR
jgi:quercetin dioxygenase-like cupin family protein